MSTAVGRFNAAGAPPGWRESLSPSIWDRGASGGKGNRERDMAVARGKVVAVFDCFN